MQKPIVLGGLLLPCLLGACSPNVIPAGVDRTPLASMACNTFDVSNLPRMERIQDHNLAQSLENLRDACSGRVLSDAPAKPYVRALRRLENADRSSVPTSVPGDIQARSGSLSESSIR